MRSGFVSAEIGIVPEDWDLQTLGEVVALRRGHDLTEKNRKKGSVPIMGSAGQNGFHDTALVLGPGIVLGRSGASFGQAHYCEHNFWPHNTALYVTDFFGNHTLFAYYLLKRIDFSRHNSGGAQQSLNRNFIAPIVVAVPRRAEQQAIAEALSDADALIESLEQLLVKKRQIKQGTMQELLTGKRRLPGFDGVWTEKSLGTIVQILKGQLITQKDAILGPIPVIAGGKQPAYFHNQSNRIGKTITISGSGASAGFVAFHNCPIFASDCSTISESSDYSIEYIFFALQLNQDVIYKAQTGGAQPHIHPRDLHPLRFQMPSTVLEQTAIATILSDMAADIAALQAKLAKARHIKQGMMQQLLTGQIRLV